MGSWYYVWNDGSVSFVSAPSKDEAPRLLDDTIGCPDIDKMKPVKDGFIVSFMPKPDPNPENNQWTYDPDGDSETIGQALSDVESSRAPAEKKE